MHQCFSVKWVTSKSTFHCVDESKSVAGCAYSFGGPLMTVGAAGKKKI